MKGTNLIRMTARSGLSVLCVLSLLTFPSGAPLYGQNAGQTPPPPVSDIPQSNQLLSPAQLENLVAPIALYPDPLLGQVMAASTYPLEVVEAQQWLQQNSNLHGADLVNAAKEQNWDGSVQALVAFPDVLTMLNRDVRWTTDLGNAFLAQQKDVMDAVQRMRVRAQQNGKLASTAQQNVTTQTQDGQSAVTIEPTSPQEIYVPEYNPEYIWGPPAYGYYPPLWYPPIGFGFGYYPGVYLGGFFPGWGLGWGGWGLGWGWGYGWFGGGLFVNNFFFNHYGFRGYYGGGRFAGDGRFGWAHDPYHRSGVPYGNRAVASQFNNQRFAAGRASAGSFNGTRSFAGNGSRGFNNSGPSAASRGFGSTNRGGFGSSNPGATNRGGFGSSNPSATNRGGNPGANRGGAGNSPSAGGWQRFNGGGTTGSPRGTTGSPQAAAPRGGETARGFAPNSRANVSPNAGSGSSRSYSSPSQSFRGGSNYSARSYSAPSTGRSYGGNSAPRSFSGGGGSSRSFSGGGGGGGARSSGGGGGGGHSGGGGGHGGGHR